MRRIAPILVLLVCASRPAAQRATVVGTVVDTTDRPIAGVAIVCDGTTVHSGPDGRFEIPVTDLASALLELQRRGYADARLPTAGRRAIGVVRLPAGAPIVGRCVDANGKAIAGIEVLAVDQLADLPYSTSASGPSIRFEARATSAADGSFRIDGGLRHGARVIAVPASGRAASYGPVDAGMPVEVVVRPARTVRGRVADSQGFPIDGAIAFVMAGERRLSDAATDREGRFELLVPDGRDLQVGAYLQRRGARISAEPRDLTTSQADADLILTVPDTGLATLRVATIDGTTGRVLTGARIGYALHGLSELGPAFMQRVLDFRSRPTPSGALTIPMLTPGTPYVISARADGRGRARIVGTVRDTRVLDVPLWPEAVVRGRAIDARSGATVAGVRFAVLPSEADPTVAADMTAELPAVETLSAADGSFELRELGPGRWLVLATLGQGHAIATCELVVAAGERIDDVSVYVDVGLAVRGRIANAPPNSSIRIWSEHSNFDDPPPVVPLPADGAFAIEHTPLGPATVELLLPLPVRLGSVRAVPLLPIDVVQRPVEVEFDATKVLCRTAGLVECVGAPPPRGRLAVWFEPWPAPEPRPGTVDGVWSIVGPDGRFAACVELGEHTLHVVDVATGVVLHSAERRIAADSHDLGPIVAATVRVDVVLPRVEDPNASRRRIVVDVGTGPPAGIELGLDQASAELYLPATGGRLSLRDLADVTGLELAGEFVRPAGATHVEIDLTRPKARAGESR